MDKFLTLDANNPIINAEYQKENGNVYIKNNNKNNNLCYIYCSSNALYNKDDEQDFVNRVVNGNRYEWKRYCAENIPAKEIFIRDVWLSWYARGINSKINTIDKLIEYMKKETEGYTTVTVGVSSGGYIASVLAAKLGAEMCINFCGQFSLKNHFSHVKNNPFLNPIKDDKYIECYNEIKGTNTAIFYFVAGKCEQDIIQSKFVEDFDNVYKLDFDTKEHGITVWPYCLPRLLSYNKKDLICCYNKYKGKKINGKKLSMKVAGILKTSVFLANNIKRLIVSKF